MHKEAFLRYRLSEFAERLVTYLLVENRLCLATISRLLAVITTLPLSRKDILAFLVLGNLVEGVLLALLVLAVGHGF